MSVWPAIAKKTAYEIYGMLRERRIRLVSHTTNWRRTSVHIASSKERNQEVFISYFHSICNPFAFVYSSGFLLCILPIEQKNIR